MKIEVFKDKFSKILYQRNILLPICILLAISQLISIICLMQKSVRVVVVPGLVSNSFWVDEKKVSPTYLEQVSVFLANVLLTKSPATAIEQRHIILRHVLPEFFGKLQRDLVIEEEKMIKDNISYVFYPVSVKLNPRSLKAFIIGDKVAFVGSKIVQKEREEYHFSFVCRGGRLFLKSLIKKEV